MLGVLMLQTRFPRPLGDIGHAQTINFPVLRRVVPGATPALAVRGLAPAVLQPFIDTAHELVALGCTAISTSCGFLALWQRELQAALQPVPVWTSQVLGAAQRLLARHPEVDTLVLECTNLPPYADALRKATGRPVLDVVTMLQARLLAHLLI